MYPPHTEDGIQDVDSCTRLAGVVHRSATAEQLPDLIELALRSLPGNVIHTIDDNGTDTVTYGPQYY